MAGGVTQVQGVVAADPQIAAITGGTVTGTNAPYVLARSFAGIATPADTSEDTLATITVPAGAMGANGSLRIYTVWSATNNANAKTGRIRFSGGAGTVYGAVSLTSQASGNDFRMIANRNATNSQVGATSSQAVGGWQVSGSAVTTSAVDTTAATTIVITGQKATSGDTLTLEGYVVEVMFGA